MIIVRLKILVNAIVKLNFLILEPILFVKNAIMSGFYLLIIIINIFKVKLVLEIHIINVVHVLLWIIEYLIILMNVLVLINITMMASILCVYHNAIIHGNNLII